MAADADKFLIEINQDITNTLDSEIFKCLGCKKRLKEPRHLPCRHVLCNACFLKDVPPAAANRSKKGRPSNKQAVCPVPGCATSYDPTEPKSALDVNVGRSMRFFGELKQLVEANIGKSVLQMGDDEVARTTGGGGFSCENHVQVTSSGGGRQRISSGLSDAGCCEHETTTSTTASGGDTTTSTTISSTLSTTVTDTTSNNNHKQTKKKKAAATIANSTSTTGLVKKQSLARAPSSKSVTPPKQQQQQQQPGTTTVAAIDKKNAKGETALQRACKKKNGAIDEVRKLLEAGANPNVCDNAGWTPLHEAAQRGDAKVIEALVARGANVNVKSMQEGTTPLHDAVTSGCLAAVEALLKAGVNPGIQDFTRKTPVDLAVFSETIKTVLLKCGDTSLASGDNNKSSTVSASGVSSSSDKPVLFAMSGFGSAQTASYVEKLRTTSLMGRICDTVTPLDVTHLVVATVENDDRLCSRRSLKFLQAVARGCWVVGVKWLDESLKAGCWLPEVDFEVTGCLATGGPNAGGAKRSRLGHQQNSSHEEPPLFASCGLFFQGHFEAPASIDSSSLHALAESLGAKVLKREPRIKLSLNALGLTPPPVYHASPESDVRDYSVFIIRDPALSPLHPGHQIRAPPLATVTYDWFLTCIETWRLNNLPPVS